MLRATGSLPTQRLDVTADDLSKTRTRKQKALASISTHPIFLCCCFILCTFIFASMSSPTYSYSYGDLQTTRFITPGSIVDMRYVEQAVQTLVPIMSKEGDICAGCQHADVALRCLVWANGTVWMNPVIISRTGSISGYEFEFGSDVKDLSNRRLRHRAESIQVDHEDAQNVSVIGAEAVCIQHVDESFARGRVP